ncbi:MAG: CoA transferase [Sphingomonadales bacterium]|nr:CoA transferase [Sphingomonadales bacterium]
MAIPLEGWAAGRLRALAGLTGSAAIAALTGRALMGERATLHGFTIPGRRSAGGGCQLLRARDGWVALALPRADDRAMLPALFGDAALPGGDDRAIAAAVARCEAPALVERGRLLGLAVARYGEAPRAPACEALAPGPGRSPAPARAPLVLDLAPLWAGPLAAHLLWLAGATVVKVENPRRPDPQREASPEFFALLNQGKANVALDIAQDAGRRALLGLIARADIVIEAGRPRGLAQFGIDADRLVAAQPGLVWVTITGHGASGEPAGWIALGDDAAIAGGLGDAMRGAGGGIGFAGDAPADPLTGILAAESAWRHWRSGCGARLGIAMSAVIAQALAEERARDGAALDRALRRWSAARGAPFPQAPARPVSAPLRALGADTAMARPC